MISAASACRSLRPILGAVHAQAPAAEIVTVELKNGGGGLGIGPELGEGEAARASGLPIGTDVNAGDLSGLRQQRGELLLGRVEAQITDEDLVRNDRLLLVWLSGGKRGPLRPYSGMDFRMPSAVYDSAGGSVGAETAAVWVESDPPVEEAPS